MKNVNWERDGSGALAYTIDSTTKKYISPIQAEMTVKALMHELTTIGADFSVYGLVNFNQMLCISLFDGSGGVFYGIYHSSDEPGEEKCCLRRVEWRMNFKTMEAVLNGLSANTLFFELKSLSPTEQGVVKSMDSLIKNDCDIKSSPSSNEKFRDKRLSYYVPQDYGELICYYEGSMANNSYVEKTFEELEFLFENLSQRNTLNPLPETFRVYYNFQRWMGIV